MANDARPIRLLQLSPRNLWPLDSGAKLREYYFARQLAQHVRLTYLGFWEAAGPRVDSPPPDVLVPGCGEILILPRGRRYSFFQLVRGALTRTPVTVLNCTTERMAAALQRLLEERAFDLVQMEGTQLAAYLPLIRAARSRPRIVVDWHNIESELMSRYSEYAPNLARRLYARRTARSQKTVERRLLGDCDAHVVTSERERQKLLQLAPGAEVLVVENGVDVAYYSDAAIEEAYGHFRGARPSKARRDRVLFAGSMDYHANIDSVTYFARAVWPQVRERLPEAVFTIAGRHPAPEVRALGALPGIDVTGLIEDIRPYYREAMAAIVPVRIAGGTRLKILEAMAAGVPVVSTPLGAEGLEVEPGVNILIGETEDEFCDGIVSLSEDPQRWRRLAAAGRALVEAHYDWAAVSKKLVDLHLSLARRAQAVVAG